MQQLNSVQLDIEHLLFNLASCVNALQHYRRQLSIDDLQQAELSFQKLAALMTHVRKQSNPLKLATA